MATQATWIAGNGSWFSAANWQEPNPSPPPDVLHYVPGSGNDVQLERPSGLDFLEITYNGTSTINTLNGDSNSDVDITGGSLTVLNGGFTGGVSVETGGTLAISAGTQSLNHGSFAGTVSGAGALRMVNSNFTIKSGASFTIDNWVVTHQIGGFNAVVTFDTDFTYAKHFTLETVFGNYPILELNSHKLTLSGVADLNGTIDGPGTLLVTGTGTFASILTGGATVEVKNVMSQVGYSSLSGKLLIDAGATYTFTAIGDIADGGGGTFVNNGAIVDSAAGLININGAFTGSSTSTISIAAGATLNFQATGAIGGSVSGDGTFALGYGAHTLNTWGITVAHVYFNGGNGGGTTTLSRNLTYAGDWSVAGQFDTIDLNNWTLTLSGTSSFVGTLDGPGTLNVTGSSTLAGLAVTGGAKIVDAGSISQTAALSLDGALTINAGKTYSFATATNINSTGGGATIVNNGTLSDAAAGTTGIGGAFTNAAGGAIVIGSGATLNLFTKGTIGGSVTGAGTLGFGFAHDVTLDATTLSVANIYVNGGNGGGTLTLGRSLSYGGTFTFTDQFGVLALNGKTLTVSATSSFGGAIHGSGTLNVTGSSTFTGLTLQDGTISVIDAGSISQTFHTYLDGTLTINAGKTYSIDVASNFNPATSGGPGATIVNNGTFADNAAGSSGVTGTFTNGAGGTISVASGATLTMFTTGTLGGSITGAGTLALGFAHNVVLQPTTLTVAHIYVNGGNGGGTLSLAGSLTYGGDFTFADGFGTLDLNGRQLTLSGTSALIGGNIIDGGTVKVSGTGTIGTISVGYGAEAATIQDAGTMTQTGAVTLHGTLQVNAGKLYTLGAATEIYESGDGGHVLVNGSFVQDVAGASTIYADVAVNATGLLQVDQGSITLRGGLTQAGVVEGVITRDGSIVTIAADAAGHRTLTGGTSANVLTGGATLDYLDGGAGADTMTGGAGSDTYVVDNAGDVVTESGGGTDLVMSSISYSLAGKALEDLTLTGSAAINATGNSYANHLIGNSAGNVLDGSTGADTMEGGAGNDTYVVDNVDDKVIESGGGTDLVQSSHSFSLAGQSLENLTLTGTAGISGTGNSLANVITGNSGANLLDGSTGADTLVGGAGDDTYVVDNAGDKVTESGGGTDLVQSSVDFTLAGQALENLTLTGAAKSGTGNSYDNVITGNASANVLDGGLGADTLTGGAGNDYFLFSTALSAANVDRIADFSVPNDTIRLDDAVFAGLSTGTLKADEFHIGAAAADTSDRIIYDSATGKLFFDDDGTGVHAAKQFAVIAAGLALTNADFQVV